MTVTRDESQILDRVSFTVPRGAFVAIVGPNGSGKTTLLRCLAGLMRPDSGKIDVLGHPPGKRRQRGIGYVPQAKRFDRHFPGRSCDLVASGIARRWPFWVSGPLRHQTHEALERVGAAHLADRQISALSGGELQRVLIARAIAAQHQLMLFDEPATGVDGPSMTQLHGMMDDLHARGTTLVVVTHDMDLATYHATHALLINRVVYGFGDPTTALAPDRVQQAYGHIGHPHTRPGEVRL